MKSNWQNKIQQHAETPPEGAWKNIANILDADTENNTNNFTKKIKHYTVTPPAAALKNIFALLAEDKKTDEIKLGNRLYNFEQTAPAAIWPVIESQLDSGAKIIQFENKKKNPKLFYTKIAAAAIAIVIAGAVWMNSNKTSTISENGTVAVQPLQQQTKKANAGADSTIMPAPEAQEKSTPIASTSSAPVKPVYKKQTGNTTNNPAFIASTATEELALNPAFLPKEKLQNSNGQIPMDIALMNTPNSYINISGPDGQTIKVSSKFSNLLSYLTEDGGAQENLDLIIQESAKWRATFAKWRNRMANNAVAPSISNFMDIIELSTILEEKDK
jgi:hypothetical protein